jgi:hypothetical protein
MTPQRPATVLMRMTRPIGRSLVRCSQRHSGRPRSSSVPTLRGCASKSRCACAASGSRGEALRVYISVWEPPLTMPSVASPLATTSARGQARVASGGEEQQSVATAQTARVWSHPPCRPFKNQSCYWVFEVAFQTLLTLTACEGQATNAHEDHCRDAGGQRARGIQQTSQPAGGTQCR